MENSQFERIKVAVDHCENCNAQRGENHYIGCMAEECPKCGNLIVACTCRIFVAEDKALAVRRLFDFINNEVAAWAFAASFSKKSAAGLAGWLWASVYSSPETVSLAGAKVGTMAKIKASRCDTAGIPRYSVADIARALGYGKRDVAALQGVFAGVGHEREADTLVWVQ